MEQKNLNHALKNLISNKRVHTQIEIQELLTEQGFAVDQSTISRTLRRLGVTKVPDSEGRLAYRWPAKKVAIPPSRSMLLLVRAILANETLIILQTDPGSASLVARFLDMHRPEGMLGTMAGDDTVFVAPVSQAHMPALLAAVREMFPITK